MHSTSQHILDVITRESRLPEINGDACVHAFFDQADCQSCVDVCPTQAWVLGDEALGLDTNACDGCGLCVPACPHGALHVHLPWVIRQFGGQIMALFACEQSGIDKVSDLVPCIHSLGLRQLLLLYNAGIEYLLVATAECVNCPRNPRNSIHQRLQQLNILLNQRNKPPMKILQRSNQVWMRIFRTDELITRGTQLSRRKFLSGGGDLLHRQLIASDPLNLPECRTIPPGQLLPTTENKEVHWPWAPMLDENKCNGCDACTKLCPTDSLQVVRDEEDLVTGYQLIPENCIGCGICVVVCDMHAISIHSWAVSTAATIDLLEKRCTDCGSVFHLPNVKQLTKTSSCRICSEHRHNDKLFQVLNEN